MATGAATQLVITTEPSATENSGAASWPQQPVVKVEDSGGNVVTSVNSGTASADVFARRLDRRGWHLGHLLFRRGHLQLAWPSTA